MATKKFTQFSTATPLTTGDYIVGYKEDGSEELKATVKQIIDLVQDSDNQTLLFDQNSKNLSITSGNTVSLSSFTANTDFDSYKTNVASATATLLPTTIYQEASGFWQAASTATSQASANTILAGGNTRGAITTIGTNDAFNFRLETNNTTRINILSSGFVGIGTANNDSRVTERLTVDGNINLRETGTETRFIEIGTGRTGNGNSYVDLIGDAVHLDFGTRILREDTGPNANSYIRHRGTGNLILDVMNTGSLKFFTASAERGTIDSVGNFSFGNVLPNERLTVSGNISATGVVYAQEGNSTQWNLASNTAINYTHANFLPLTGGIISGETRINNNLTVWGNISATGTTTFANTVFSTTSALSVVHIGSGPAIWVGNNGDGDIASFYDIDSDVEVLHVGGNTGSFPNVGVKTSTPNKDFTVNGEISASNTIYDNVGNSTQWNQAYTTVQSNSAFWEESAEILPTVTNYLSTNNVLISSLEVNAFSTFKNKLLVSGQVIGGALPEGFSDINPFVGIQLYSQFGSSEAEHNGNILMNRSSNSGAISNNIRFQKSRGNLTDPLTIQNNDRLGGITFTGYLSSASTSFTRNTYTAADINVFVDKTPSVALSSVPGRLSFSTTTSGNTIPTERLVINSDGLVGIGTINPNSTLTVVGTVSTSQHGDSTQWNQAYNVTTAYQSASSSFTTNTDFDSYKTNVASATATLLPLAGGTLTGNLTVNGTVSASSTIFSAGRRAVTTNTTTVPGTSAVTSILAVSALPVVQETGVLYIVI
jgi:hypothetical protein